MAPSAAGRSYGKRKSSDAGNNEIKVNNKRRKSETGATNTTAGSGSTKTARRQSTKSKTAKTSSGPEVKLVVVRESGGKKDYVPARQRFEENYDGYLDESARSRIASKLGYDSDGFDSLSDLDDDDLEEADPEGEMERFKTEYTVSIRTAQGETIGQITLLVVDLTESDDDSHFWTCWETQSELAEFGELFDHNNDDRCLVKFHPDGTVQEPEEDDGGPPLSAKVESAGTKCWGRYEFTQVQPVVFVLKLTIQPQWQGKGYGSQAYASLPSLKQIRGARFLFAKPGPLERAPSVTSSSSSDWVERGRRIRAFHRRVGFRRIGNSQFFALALDHAHPSRTIKPEDDAEYVPAGKLSKEQRQRMVYMFA